MNQYDLDRRATIENRDRLARNRNLLYWYEQLYLQQFGCVGGIEGKRVLEIGSGTSPLKRFYPHVLTSDVLKLDYLDFVFDCHDIDTFSGVPDASLDVITVTNVLHHLQDPISFLNKAASKLKPGGAFIATEPYLSLISSVILRCLHHEPVDCSIVVPCLPHVEGPLASANQAMPYLIFKKRRDWLNQLGRQYDLNIKLRPFTGLAYFATGGISHKIPMPQMLYRSLFALDRVMAQAAPGLWAAFFTVVLRRLPRTALPS